MHGGKTELSGSLDLGLAGGNGALNAAQWSTTFSCYSTVKRRVAVSSRVLSCVIVRHLGEGFQVYCHCSNLSCSVHTNHQ